MNTEEKNALNELYHVLVDENNPRTLPYIHVLGELVGQSSDFITLKSLLASDSWPAAIDPHLICGNDSEVDKISRAESILELLVEKDLKDKRFLDFGCGEGHVSYKALVQDPVVSVGYDIAHYESWQNFGPGDGKLFYTTSLEEVKTHAPYDIILAYDVIDHVNRETAVELLMEMKELLDVNGTLYMRAHPFCSRHATHLYHTINKAYVHLVFNKQELMELGYESPETARVTFPIAQYGDLIKRAGLHVSHNNILREKVESFFKKNALIKERIRMNFKETSDKHIDKHIKAGGFPEFQCEQQFLDFVIKKKERI